LLKNLGKMCVHYLNAHENALEVRGKVYSYPLINALTARWLLHQAGRKGDDLKDFDGLLESARQANMVPEINREHFWEAIAVTDCDLLSALKNKRFDKEIANGIGDSYERISRVASSASH